MSKAADTSQPTSYSLTASFHELMRKESSQALGLLMSTPASAILGDGAGRWALRATKRVLYVVEYPQSQFRVAVMQQTLLRR